MQRQLLCKYPIQILLLTVLYSEKIANRRAQHQPDRVQPGQTGRPVPAEGAGNVAGEYCKADEIHNRDENKTKSRQ